jgi:putative glutamine amidotransferase
VKPLIGIPLCLDEHGRGEPPRPTLYLATSYARAVEEAGGIPVHLPLQADAEALAKRTDGLLIPGGGDFLPERPYPAGVVFDSVPAEQLEFDRRLLAASLAAARPVLGICYGMQLLALHHGGRLHYDIASDLPGAGLHRLPENGAAHALRIDPGSRLAAALGDSGTAVNSRHHQAVSDPGAGLRVSARAEDGVVEAVERDDGPFCLGVQWHPERMEAPHRERLFSAFINACRPA